MFKLLGATWGTVAAFRVETFERGWRSVAKLPRPTLSIGGLSVGGVGKTPAVAALTELLFALGVRPAILSRGYRRKGRKPLLVSRGDGRVLVGSRQAGDEPYWLARTLPRATVAVAGRREEAASLALDSAEIDVFLLDDAFQHLRVAREVDLLVVDSEMPFWRDAPIPSGRLRERPSAASRADAFLLVSRTGTNVLPSLRARHPDRPVFELGPKEPAAWPLTVYGGGVEIERHGGSTGTVAMPSDTLHPGDLPQPLYAFAGIARPSRFYEGLKNAGVALAGSHDFPDHHPYKPTDLRRLERDARAAGARALITTEKDAVRIQTRWPSVQTYVWRYRLTPQRPEVLGKWLLGRIALANGGPR